MMEMNEEIFPASGTLQTPTPEEVILDGEAYQRLVAYIKEMSLIHQEILLLRYFYEMTEQEISDLLEVKRQLVNSRLFRARNQLKEILGKEGNGQ